MQPIGYWKKRINGVDTELRIKTTETSKVTYVTCDYDVELIVDTHPGEGRSMIHIHHSLSVGKFCYTYEQLAKVIELYANPILYLQGAGFTVKTKVIQYNIK